MKRTLIACLLVVSTMIPSMAQQATVTTTVARKATEKEKIPKVDPAMKTKVDALVVKLGDESFKVRKQAKKDLKNLGDIEQYLKPHLTHDDVETRENVKEILGTNDPYRNLKPDKAEPGFFRKRALKKGAKPETVGEKIWLDQYKKGAGGVRGAAADALEAVAPRVQRKKVAVGADQVEAQARAEAMVAAIAKAIEAEKMAEAEALAAKKKAEADAAKK